ncbi:MAG: Holliday junction branch migration protein RuvA [Chloroflexota bacterium]
MIVAVRGRLEGMGLDSVIVEVGGVSLRVFVPLSLLNEVGEIGSEVKFYTHFYIREDQLSLYGFKNQPQLDLFEMLISVAGVGPKAALSLISAATVEAIHLAIAQSEVDFLKKVPGIGPKTASRIILELKGKLVEVSKPTKTVALTPGADNKSTTAALERRQVIEALTNLGYSSAEVQTALATLPQDRPLTLEEQVLECLRYLGQ